MAAAPPSLPDDLIQEILLRFPTDDPTCLLRSSLVCKGWSNIIFHPSFRRRLHKIHEASPVLGFLHDEANERTPYFIPTTASSFSLAAPDHRSWRALDCRHGRALFLSRSQDAKELLVWEPITGTQERVPLPVAFEFGYSAAAVFCAVDRCDHRGCLGGPFCVLFVFSSKEDADEYVTSACAYSLEIGAWGGMTTMHGEFIGFTKYSSVLIDSSLLYFIVYDYVDTESILEYDLSRHVLTIFSVPGNYYDCTCTLMVTEDGGLGLIQDLRRHLKLWTREASDGTDAKWLLSRVIYPHNLLPTSALLDECYVVALKAFAEGANAIFFTTVVGLFAIDLQSELVMKVSDHCGFRFHKFIPIVTFYTPAPRGDHQNQLLSKPSEEACSGEGGEGEKTIHQAHELFNKGSNAINEGEFVNTFECISHDNMLGFRIMRKLLLDVLPRSRNMDAHTMLKR
ncbi:hypothetical protein CFC21_074643 [Triticum aestivum]|uniref:F-box domain-containing protein n=2 Tax=Triticum aestivum TaxID=4565 RepID=A0A9R1HQF8_WHEAT|nr:uncharacterized protein LOC123117569 [Triticum aestivum]KAF7068941.1 hypothetical protein CFC21_074641 [Triticum aestivum]KAF7068944.1 hypothetical protein CFC21_074643 [Triticum aestivum]